MIGFATFLLGGTLGVALYLYISSFIERLQTDVYAAYVELFPNNPPPFQRHLANLQTQKCGHVLQYFFVVGFIFSAFTALAPSPSFALWFSTALALLWAIAYLDWRYRLISPTPCLGLLALGLFGAAQSFSDLMLEQSLQSAAGFFLLFYAVYWFAKWHYKQEAFGRGDYWLALAIGSYLPLEQLPIFLLIACVTGILFALPLRKTKEFLPFAPFLCLSFIILNAKYLI